MNSKATIRENFRNTNMAKAAFLVVLKILMILISAGWIAIWILKPTDLWNRKWKDAEESSRTTVFGYYGLNFAVYTFPVIALAIIGFVYLSIRPREPRSRQVRSLNTAFSKPFVVNSLLGSLSGFEILAVCLFMLYLAWTLYIHLSQDFKKLKPAKSLKLDIWQLKYLKVAIRFGLLSEACLALLLLPILRGMALFRLLGIQFEASVRYHIWLGTAMIFFATFHGGSSLFIWGVSHYIQDEIWKWQKTGRIYLAGEIALITGLVIWVTSLPQIRRKKFEIFYYTHHLYIVFLVFFLFHVGDRHFYMVFSGIFLFGLDKLLRIVQSKPETCILSARVFPCKALELILPKDPTLKYTPTSTIFMKIPSISRFQWHSFSITSSSSMDNETMSVIIKCEGWWTNFLYEIIHSELKSDADQKRIIPVAIEGPYGPDSVDFLRYDSLLLVAGGIGITPFLSILQEIGLAQSSGRKKFPTRIQLIYAVKKSQDISLLNSISYLLLNRSAEQWHLKLKIFVTQEERSGATLREVLNELPQVQTVHLCTKGSNYAIHGLQSLPWMAATVGLASIVFLISLSCFNHIFVPSQKMSSKDKTPSSVADLILILSFTIAIMSSAAMAIILRWRGLKRETPTVSRRQGKATQVYSSETGCALDEHEIYYGGRPNFPDVFSKFQSETGGSDIGVLVCGSETMKESVASLCKDFKKGAKKQKPNFSFHSLNFTL